MTAKRGLDYTALQAYTAIIGSRGLHGPTFRPGLSLYSAWAWPSLSSYGPGPACCQSRKIKPVSAYV